MQGFGVHTSLWSLDWTRKAAELAIPEAARYGLAFVEIALLDPPAVDAEHTRALLEKHEMVAVCSLGLPDAFVTHGDAGKQRRELGLDADGIARACRELAAKGAKRGAA
mgnify:CR=1 FL=1